MRISEIEIHEFSYRVADADGLQYAPGNTYEPPSFVLTVRTADGLEGHYRGLLMTQPMVTHVEMSADALLGRDPLEREAIWQELWRSLRHMDHLGLGPIDVALWDLAGRHYGESVAKLLGGYRERIPSYASTYMSDDAEDGLSSPEAYAEFARDCLERGYPGFKIHGFGDPRRDIELCRRVAAAVGDEMDLMIDPASEYRTYAEALRVGRVLDELGFFWYEDPMAETGESVHAHRRLTRDLDTPILGTEHVRGGPFSRANHIAADALDLVRGDVHLDGGITGVMKIAALAESFGLDVELHVGGPATLHCLSAIRNTNYFEKALLHPEAGYKTSQGFVAYDEDIDDDGNVAVPDGPGLGVEIDWDFVEERATDHHVFSGS